jgi:LPXTG-site transpeptidase (sortase) family protein
MMIRRALNEPSLSLLVTIIVLTLQVAVVYVAAATQGYTFNDNAILDPDVSGSSSNPVSSTADVERLRIPSMQVDAKVEVAGLDEKGAMENPSGPGDVAWYEFGPLPGNQGNAIFSGHVDHSDTGPAVFWDLRELRPNSVIDISLTDGTTLSYRVVAKTYVNVASAPIDAIVGPTSNESITLITCSGAYDETGNGYDQRLIVRAERATRRRPHRPGQTTPRPPHHRHRQPDRPAGLRTL